MDRKKDPKELLELAAKVLDTVLKLNTRDQKWVKYTFPADEALVVVSATLARAATAGVTLGDLLVLRETLSALGELGEHAPERSLIEMVAARTLAAGVKTPPVVS